MKNSKIEFVTMLHAKLNDVTAKRDEAREKWHNTQKESDYDDVVWFNAQRAFIRNLIDEIYTEIALEAKNAK